jgi:putative membrane protein
MSEPRRPAAFRIDPEPAAKAGRGEPTAHKPRAIPKSDVTVVPAEIDVFDAAGDPETGEPRGAIAPRRRSRLSALFLTAFGALVALGIGLWTDQLIRDLFERSDWLGWLAVAAAAIAVISLIIILARELFALARLASVEKIRRRALNAIARDDAKEARAVVTELSAFVSGKPETAAGRRTLAELDGEVIDGANLVRLAETEILGPLDAEAKLLILDAAKRVLIVTTVSPRALLDIAYVLFESGRLIRRLAELYGGRPGTLGFFRLARNVLAHLAITGSMAAGDSLVQQLVGHGLAARLSAKLGEGVVNGMMTARIGIAAMETARPLPFSAVKRPGISDFLSALTAFARRKSQGESRTEKFGPPIAR